MHVWGPAENKFSFSTFRTRLLRHSTSPLHHLWTFRRGRGVSVRSEWHTRIPQRTSQFRSWEKWERRADFVDKGLHSETAQGNLSACTSHSTTWSPPRRTGSHPLHQRTDITASLTLEYFLYLITAINYRIQKSSDMKIGTWLIVLIVCFKAAFACALNGGERWTVSSGGIQQFITKREMRERTKNNQTLA